ncbi:MAG TPA: helix-turn-helix domain-containing protein [Roseiarcus sp.]|jgi:excisionase family DNA binding protein
MARRHSSRRVKIHRNYTIAEAAALLGAHKHTVSRWIAAGLPTTDDHRPFLIHGEDLRAFLKAREPVKQTCRPGEFYCLRCKAPRRPAGDWVEYLPKTALRGLLRGICPTCDALIHRAATLGTIAQKGGGLDVAFPKAEGRIGDLSHLLSNVDFKQDAKA